MVFDIVYEHFSVYASRYLLPLGVDGSELSNMWDRMGDLGG